MSKTLKSRVRSSFGVMGIMSVASLFTSAIISPAASAATDTNKTLLGTPRDETLIVDSINGTDSVPSNWNPYAPGVDTTQLHDFAYSPLWEINTSTGKQFPDLASTPIQPLDKTDTKFRINLRKGIYWTDGVEFTSNDVVWTINMLLHNPKISEGGYLRTLIKSVQPAGRFALDITTLKSDAHIQLELGSFIWGSGLYILPEHIWKNKNPLTFKNFPVVSTGPYLLKKYDPNGNYFLWELRSDWKRSDVGQIEGKPTPKYVLYDFYGTEQSRVIAGIQHKLDVFMPLSPYGWTTLHKRDPYIEAWHKDFPYADMSDPAARGMGFNDQKYPFNKWQVRWALALAINLPQVAMSYDGMLRSSPLPFTASQIAQKTIYPKMEPFLEHFKLPDGFMPYNTKNSDQLMKLLRKNGVQNLPTSEAQVKNLFGWGWWKYAPQESKKLLESVGFKQSSNGQWLLPNGKPWSITVDSPSNFEPEAMALSSAVANQWKEFGISTNLQSMNSSTYWTSWSDGTEDTGTYWPVMFVTPDSSEQLVQYDQKYITPAGQYSTNPLRWSTPEVTKLVEDMQKNPFGSQKTINDEIQFMKIWIQQMPMIEMADSSQLVPVDTYYWTNFPTSTNSYNGPWWWWSTFKFILPHLKPTGKQ